MKKDDRGPTPLEVIRGRAPWSACGVSIAYMVAMSYLDNGDGRTLQIWFLTAIPVFWAWIFLVLPLLRRLRSTLVRKSG